MEHDSPFDLAIVGAGLVGASLARALARADATLALLEPRPPTAPPGDGSWDSRVYAISPASERFLAACGVWQALPPERLQAVYAMEVRGDAGGQMDFDAYDAGLPALCHIVESRELAWALWQALESQGNLSLVTGTRPETLAMEPRHASLALADGRRLDAALVVGADGAESWVRRQAGLEARLSPYAHSALVANFACSTPHRGVARQWFRADGVLAFLPLPGERVSIVWSTGHEHAAELAALAPEALAATVAEAGQGAGGELRLLTAPALFPLRLGRVPRLVAPRVALVGDAGHNVHPLAGQGVNLGFGDAEVLAGVIAGRGPRGCGELKLLRRFERARQEDILAMQTATDGLYRLFSAQAPLLRELRNRGLSLTDTLGPLKRVLVRRAAGSPG